MSLRDYFAGQALCGFFANTNPMPKGSTALSIAEAAYKAADAMLEARK
jgi:hypothetical protein